MHPEPQLGVPSHVHLEDACAALSEFTDRVLRFLLWRLDRVFVNHPIPAAGQGKRKEWNHRCAGADGNVDDDPPDDGYNDSTPAMSSASSVICRISQYMGSSVFIVAPRTGEWPNPRPCPNSCTVRSSI